ncbi:MAG TPA: type III pantothenate kinase [Firmicutes bacterium]|jgi:type III pantothenate kinase|nr:type III pantothenate kinase [Bacillota bacterium]
MLLVLDIGNSQTVIGVFLKEKLLANWRLATDRRKTVDEYGMMLKSLFANCNLDPGQIQRAAIANVVPPLTGLFEKVVEKYFSAPVLVVGPGIKTGLSIKMENPREIGADLIANAIAGVSIYGPPFIIVDFGTATTFCAVGSSGDYLGGAIVPGLNIVSEALFQRAAELPHVPLLKPKNVIGKNTVSAIQSGLVYGYIGLVEGMIFRIKTEMNCDAKVIATGGLSELIVGETKLVNITNPYLTLEGLRLISEFNK